MKPSASDRDDGIVSRFIEAPIGCAMCGDKQGDMVMTVHRETGHKAVTCSTKRSKCTGNFWAVHSRHERVTPAAFDWSYRAKVIASKQILQGDTISNSGGGQQQQQQQSPGHDQQALEKTVQRIGALKERLALLYSDYEKKKKSLDCEKPIKDWIVAFDQFMRDLNELYSSEFPSKFLGYARDLELLHRQKQAGNASSETFEVLELLRELIKTMPLNRVLYEKRALLKTVLGFDKYAEDKLVLTLDGGGASFFFFISKKSFCLF
jgi:hypothetical protein